MAVRVYDEQLDANRVVLVGQELTVDSVKIAEALKEAVKSIQVNFPEGPKFMPQEFVAPEVRIEYVDKPVIVEKIVYREVEKPITVIQKVVEVVQVEKPVIVERQVVVQAKPDNVLRTMYIVKTLAAVVTAVCLLLRF